MTPLDLQIGSVAEIIAAVAALASTVLTIVALKIARAANDTAESAAAQADKRERDAQAQIDQRAREALQRQDEREREALRREQERDRDSQKREADRDERERSRDRRHLASALQAWWVAADERWGVFVSNRGTTPTVFHQVEVTVTGNAYNTEPIRIECLPPGDFFVESKTPWPFPEAIDDATNLCPIMQTRKYAVLSIRFTDPLGVRWCWDPKAGLQET